MNIKPIIQENGNDPRWLVIVQDLKNKSDNLEFEFDSVIICNGHHNKGKYPKEYEQIKASFHGELLHSRDYTSAKRFQHKNVVVIGGGPSGIDISIAISRYANQVYLCTKDLKKRSLSNVDGLSNLRQTMKVQIAKKNSVVLENSEEISCDVIVFCTGYEYDFPFLANEFLEVQEGGKLVTPLYHHVIHRKFRSLGFIGIPYIALAFLMCDCQSRFYVAYLRGDLTLPNTSEMEKHFLADQLLRKQYGMDGPRGHLLYNLQWPYFQELAQQADFTKELEPFTSTFAKVYQIVVESHIENPLLYRKIDYESILKSSKYLNSGEDKRITF